MAITLSSNNTRVIKFHVSAALRTAVGTHVAEILRDAGLKVAPDILPGTTTQPDVMFPQGLHVREIAKPTGVHPGKLGMFRHDRVEYVHS